MTAAFPFADSPEGIDAALLNGHSKNAPAAIKPLLRGFEPYETGNSMLWALNKMRNTSTHAVLVEPSVYTNGVHAFPLMPLQGSTSDVRYEMIFQVGEWDPVRREIEILRITAGEHPPFRLQNDYYISVSNVALLRGKSTFKVFEELGPMVQDIVGTIEAETIRLLS